MDYLRFSPISLMIRRFFILTLLVLTSYCSKGDNRLETYVEAGQSLLNNNPRQGITYFESLLERFPDLSDSALGYIDGILGTGYAMCGRMDSARIYMEQAVLRIPSGTPRIYALKNLASVCRIQNDYAKADSLFTVALLSFTDSTKNGNLQAMLLGEQASVYMDQGQNRTAIPMLKKGLRLCQQAAHPDTTTLSILRNKLANIYLNTENYPMAITELESILPLIDAATDLYNYCTTTSSLARALLSNGERDKALPWLDKALKATQKLNNQELEGFVLMLFGKSCAMARQREKASTYFDSAYSKLRSTESDFLNDCAIEYLNFLAQWNMFKEGNAIINDPVLLKKQEVITAMDLLRFKRAALPILINTSTPAQTLKAYQEILPLTDSVTKLQLDQTLIDSKAEFRLREKELVQKELEQKNKLLEQENHIRNTQFVVGIVAVIALLFLVLYLVLRHRNKEMLQQRELERTKQEVELREQRLALESQLRAMREKVILQQKNDLLTQVEEIDKLKTELEKAADANNKSAEAVFANQLVNGKNKIGLEQFLQQFNSIYPNFFPSLSNGFPSLSTSDLQFCALIRLNLSIKDISTILGIEPKSAYKKKYRIEEKMGLETGTHLEKVLFNV